MAAHSQGEFDSAAAEVDDALCEDVDCSDPILQVTSCAPVGSTELCGTTLATIASTCCGYVDPRQALSHTLRCQPSGRAE